MSARQRCFAVAVARSRAAGPVMGQLQVAPLDHANVDMSRRASTPVGGTLVLVHTAFRHKQRGGRHPALRDRFGHGSSPSSLAGVAARRHPRPARQPNSAGAAKAQPRQARHRRSLVTTCSGFVARRRVIGLAPVARQELLGPGTSDQTAVWGTGPACSRSGNTEGRPPKEQRRSHGGLP